MLKEVRINMFLKYVTYKTALLNVTKKWHIKDVVSSLSKRLRNSENEYLDFERWEFKKKICYLKNLFIFFKIK